MSDVLFPEMRENVTSAVRALSDEVYQRRVWVERKYPQVGYYDDFSMNLNILFDDTLVLEDPTATLGKVLNGQEEVLAMEALASAIATLLEDEGSDKSDEEYIASPQWGAVVRSAVVAYRIMTQPG